MIETDRLYCVHISSEDDSLIRQFQLANDHGGFLAEYLKKETLSDENNFRMRTYLVYDKHTSELVGYYSLKAGFVSSKENSNFFNFGFDSIPGVELANFAVNGAYKRNHPEIQKTGTYIFLQFVIPTVKEAAEYIGIDILYIFALPYKELVKYYKHLGFSRLNRMQERSMHRRIRPNYDEGCIFMYQQL